jgi:hypothetical protein
MSVQLDLDFAGADDAKTEIAAAARYLLKDATGSTRSDIVREIMEIVGDIANGMLQPRHGNPPDARAMKQRTAYKAYVIDTFQREKDRWRATIRKSDGKKIRVAVPLAVVDATTTTTDALTAEKAVELAKHAIDEGDLT